MSQKHIGILTAGGDCQGLNAALRGVTLAALNQGWRVTGIHDGFVGLAEKSHNELTFADVYGIAGIGGTILGTGRGGGRARNTEEAVEALTGSAVYYLNITAGGCPKAGLHGKPDHDGGAASV